jgi:hypothetical protein
MEIPKFYKGMKLTERPLTVEDTNEPFTFICIGYLDENGKLFDTEQTAKENLKRARLKHKELYGIKKKQIS